MNSRYMTNTTRLHLLDAQRKIIMWLQLSSKSSKNLNFACIALLQKIRSKISKQCISFFPNDNPRKHNEAWLKSNKLSTEGSALEDFVVSHGLFRIVDKLTFYPSATNSSSSNSNLFLTTYPQSYSSG